MKKSTPTPLSVILLAHFFHPGCSVWNSFFSVSIPWSFWSSLMNNRPGPHVGSAEREQMILPPVAVSAASAAVSVGSKAGSGFLMSEKNFGICVRSDVIVDLRSEQVVAVQTLSD